MAKRSLRSIYALGVLAAAVAALPARGDCGPPDVESVACPSLTGLGPASAAFGISADGHTVVGRTATGPVRWRDGVPESLGSQSDWLGTPSAYAAAVTADGSYILGSVSVFEFEHPFAWTPEHGVQILDVSLAWPYAISEDRRVLAGAGGIGDVAALVVDGASVDISHGTQARAVSADGTHVVGSSWAGTAVLWQRSGAGLVAIDLLRPWLPESQSDARGISPDGRIIVGNASPHWQDLPLPIRWDELAYTLLPTGAFDGGMVRDLSADGSRLVGELTDGSLSTYEAALWYDDDSVERLPDRLDLLAVDRAGWSLHRLHAVSDDGWIAVGSGRRAGVQESFIANLSPSVGMDIRPGSSANTILRNSTGLVMVALYGTHQLDLAALDLGSVGFGPARAPVVTSFPPDDLNGDGLLDRRLLFSVPATGLRVGDTEACLTASGRGGFRVCGPVAVTPGACGVGFEAGLALLPLMAWSRWLRRQR